MARGPAFTPLFLLFLYKNYRTLISQITRWQTKTYRYVKFCTEHFMCQYGDMSYVCLTCGPMGEIDYSLYRVLERR